MQISNIKIVVTAFGGGFDVFAFWGVILHFARRPPTAYLATSKT